MSGGLVTKSEVLRRLSIREFEDGTRHDLIQLGLEYWQAESLIIGYSPKEQIDVETYYRARHVIDERRRMRAQLKGVTPNPEPIDMSDLLLEAGSKVVAGEDVFTVKADLMVALNHNGYGEILLPHFFDPDFWSAQHSPEKFARYFAVQEQIHLPEGLSYV